MKCLVGVNVTNDIPFKKSCHINSVEKELEIVNPSILQFGKDIYIGISPCNTRNRCVRHFAIIILWIYLKVKSLVVTICCSQFVCHDE